MIARVGVLLLSAIALRAQVQPEARAVLEKVAATYSAASEYYIEMEATTDPASDAETMSTRVSFRAPNQYRLETEFKLRRQPAGASAEVRALSVTDGSKWWEYQLPQNVYATTRPLGIDADQLVGIAQFRDPIKTFQQQNLRSIRLIPEERIQTASGETLCLVIEMTYSDGMGRMWIEKSSSLVWKFEYFDATYLYKKIELHAKLPDSTFQFTPPPDARLLDPAEFPPR